MVATLSTKIKEKGNSASLMRRELNDATREALRAAAKFWIKKFLPLHFELQAVQRYGYAARDRVYRRIKREIERIKIAEFSDVTVPAPKPAKPLVWTGEMRDEVLGRPLSEYKIKARATAKKQTVKVPVRIPHPLNPKNSGELTRLINEEIRAMQRIALAKFEVELRKIEGQKTETIK